MKSIFDRSFQYTSSVETDLKKTFARIRRQMRDQEQARVINENEKLAKVSPIKHGKTVASF